ncbi:MAG TPA: T9SS type A sorting domain-containing protein [bacterium]|nr:T9SS type A sorting domain-containing protein [bacterium]HNT67241.1 T9SS type A sorting domain-containing protein [bacterium]
MKKSILVLAVILFCSASDMPCFAQYLWYENISKSFQVVRGDPVVLAQIPVSLSRSGRVLVHFDGCVNSDPEDRIQLAASNKPNWEINDGVVSVESILRDYGRSFSHTRLYEVEAGKHKFYAVANNYVETDGSGQASFYGTLVVKYFPDPKGLTTLPFVRHTGIQQSEINVRGSDVVVAQLTISPAVAGFAVVRFDGYCLSDPGDLIVVAASDKPSWSANGGNVGLKAFNADINRNSFSHSRGYEITAGSHTFYAVARNYVDLGGSGKVSIYGSLTVEFFPKKGLDASAAVVAVNQTNLDVRTKTQTLTNYSLTPGVAGMVMIHFDGQCWSHPGDRIVLAASNTTNWGANDGNVSVQAHNASLEVNPFSHTRVYDVAAGGHSFWALANNYVNISGPGTASIYGNFTVEFFPDKYTDVQDQVDIPTDFQLQQNYPNPFNPWTKIRYSIKAPGQHRLMIYNALGEKIRTLADRYAEPGLQEVIWDGQDDNGITVPAGVYFYALSADGFSETRKMVLIK